MRVFIVDPHSLYREGLKNAIATTLELTVVGESPVLDGLPSRDRSCDVLTLPDSIEGLSFVRTFHERNGRDSKPRFLVIADHANVSRGVRFIAEGAAGYIGKSASQEEILQALRTVSVGRNFITPELAQELVERMGSVTNRALSSREYEVLFYLASGLSVSETAVRLNLSIKTVSTYRGRILEKLRLKSNSGLIRYAVRENIISVDGTREDVITAKETIGLGCAPGS